MEGDRCTARCSKLFGQQRFCGSGGVYVEEGSVDCSACAAGGRGSSALRAPGEEEETDRAVEEGVSACEDDDTWIDPDGHTCQSYRNTIAKWGQDRVCKQHHGGKGALHCRATCGTCKSFSGDETVTACADNVCIGPWLEAYGRCFQCADYAKGCSDHEDKEVFLAECPLTCGLCKVPEDKTKTNSSKQDEEEKQEEWDETCEDEDAEFCDDLGARYCSERAFAKVCRRTCDLCLPAGAEAAEEACVDRFSTYTCARYESYGWCTRQDTRDSVRLQCPLTCGVCVPEGGKNFSAGSSGARGSRQSGRKGKDAKEEKEDEEAAKSGAWRRTPSASAITVLLLAAPALSLGALLGVLPQQ